MDVLKDYCRLCMRKRDDRIDLFAAVKDGESYEKRIENIFCIQIDEDKGLPSSACSQCINMIEEAEAFSRTIQSTQIAFQDIIYAQKEKHLMQIICRPVVTEASSQEDTAINSIGLKRSCPAVTETPQEDLKLEDVTMAENAPEEQSASERSEDEGKRRRKGNNKTFTCEICGKVLLHNLSLKNHMKLHQEKRDAIYICEICGKGYDIQSQLTAHTYTHRDQKTEECPHCGKHFLMLKRHIKVNHQQKGHGTCTICNKSFKAIRSHNARFHSEMTDPAKFTCKLCGRALADRTSYRRHLDIHTGKKYTCLFCPHEATEDGNSRAHMKNKHPIEYAAHLKEKEKKWYQPRVKKGV